MRLMGRAGCHLRIICFVCLFVGCFCCCCFQPPSAVFPPPALPRHFHTGVRGWESHGHGTTLENSVGGDFVALVFCPNFTMDMMEKPELFKSVIRPPRAELLSEVLLPRKLGQHSFGSEGCFPHGFGWKTAGQSCAHHEGHSHSAETCWALGPDPARPAWLLGKHVAGSSRGIAIWQLC